MCLLFHCLICVLISPSPPAGHGIWVWQYDDKKKPAFDVPGPDGNYWPPAQAAFYLFLTMIIVLQVTMEHNTEIT